MTAVPFPGYHRLLVTACFLFIGLMMLQDLLSARHHGYSYYWSESLLFSSGALYILPVSLVMERVSIVPGRKYRFAGHLILILLAVLVQLVLYGTGIYLISVLALDHTYSIWGNLQYAFSSSLIVYLFIYGVIAALLYLRPESGTEKQALDLLELADGKAKVFLRPEEIVFLQSAGPYVAIHTGTRKYLHKASLRDMESTLGSDFLRVHRSTIVNIRKVRQSLSRGNGDHDLVLEDGKTIRLSRNYLSRFRQRLRRDHSA